MIRNSDSNNSNSDPQQLWDVNTWCHLTFHRYASTLLARLSSVLWWLAGQSEYQLLILTTCYHVGNWNLWYCSPSEINVLSSVSQIWKSIASWGYMYKSPAWEIDQHLSLLHVVSLHVWLALSQSRLSLSLAEHLMWKPVSKGEEAEVGSYFKS